MPHVSGGADSEPRRSWRQRLHGALMPDYNPKATAYWWSIVLLGAAALFVAVAQLLPLSGADWLQIVVGMSIAMLAGLFPVRIPHSKNSFAAGEIFIFLLLLLHGPAAATLAAAGEAVVGSYRSSRRWTSRIASPAMAAVAMFAAGSLLQAVLDRMTRAAPSNEAGLLVLAAMAVAMLYFVGNTMLVTAVPRLKRNERFQTSDLFGVFGWVGIAYTGSAAVAALLFLSYQQSGLGVLMAVVPLIGMMLATLHYFFRQQEVAEAARRTGAEAAERETEQAARHVRELEASERRFHSAFTHASIGMALLSFDGQVLQDNPALRTLLGADDADLLRHRFQDFVFAEDLPEFNKQLGLFDGGEFEGLALELRCCHRSAGPVWVIAHCSFFSEPGATSPCLILQVQDIDAQRKAEAGLQHIAFHDSLTGLPNRRRFHEHLAKAVELARAQPPQPFAVMFLDFDRFKLINDSLGHNAGDEFLVQVARRIEESMRPSDIVARLGGDEFAILARHIEHEQTAVVLAERLMEALRRPFMVTGTELNTSASIGITFSAFGYTTPEQVLRDADTAMYKAKGAGKARYALFDAGLHTEVAGRLQLEGDLRRAIDAGQLEVAYQPLYELTTGQLTGFEALARWNHPTQGAISPLSFIPIAEESGMMVRLSDFVLNCACRQLAAWQALDPACGALSMHVNMSGNDIAHNAFVARVTRALVEAGLRPAQLTLELTENILMSRLEAALPMLRELRRLGVSLSVDDFGTGYSSLSHLSSLPIDSLKIDRSFVCRLMPGSDEATVVRAVIGLGRSLGKTVIAEGIETHSQLGQLREMGCHVGQGYHLSRPITPLAAGELLVRGGLLSLPPLPDVDRVEVGSTIH